MATPYATLDACRAELKAGVTVQDEILRRYIYQASARIDSMAGARDYYAPSIKTRSIPVNAMNVSSYNNTYQLNQNLLSLTGVSLNGSALTVGTNVEAYPTDATPYTALHLIGGCGLSWYDWCNASCGIATISVSGTWGFRRDYAEAWEAVDALASNITTSDTSLTVADVDGTDSWGFTPRLSAGNLIRIDDEMMVVNSASAITNIVTVKRAVNGTTAATHTATTEVEVFYPEETINRAIIRQAGFMFARRGAYEASSINEIGVITFPQDTLLEFRNAVQELQYG